MVDILVRSVSSGESLILLLRALSMKCLSAGILSGDRNTPAAPGRKV